ncbi:MAG: hypothetical protein Q8K65_12585 [Alphaproteobacteria bacterium]|nr:hypothetical protein [Syntrophales bacterium]MDP2207130.1 hypothetical protein [Alphaproteobacteria bacterium]
MIPSICQKMQRLINQGITRECEVAYLLTCIRKILEQEENNNGQWDNLKFYCDWGLHAKLSGSAAQGVLNSFNEVYLSRADREQALPSSVEDISKFKGLILEVKNFLTSRDIIIPQSANSDWSKFIFLYASIVEDCPLIINAHLSPLSEIQKVTARVELAKEIKLGQQYYKVSWIITDSAGDDGELYIINSFDA